MFVMGGEGQGQLAGSAASAYGRSNAFFQLSSCHRFVWALLTSIVGEPIPILHTHGQTFTTSMVVFDKLNIILVLVPTEYEWGLSSGITRANKGSAALSSHHGSPRTFMAGKLCP